MALSHCHELRSLNLELVSQAMGMNDLFQHFKGLRNLRDLKFPRSMLLGAGDAQKMRNTQFDLPAKLECFSLTGGLSDTFMMKLNAPASLNELHISHLSFARQTAINNFLGRIASQLTVLEVNFHIPMLPYNALDKVLVMCPNLVKLSVAVDFVTYHLFDEENTPAGHPLKQLDLDSSGVDGTELKLKSDDLYICLAEDRLQKVRIVRINERLNWMQREEEDVMDLISLLESRVDEKEKAEGALCGVWEFVNNDCRLRW